MKIDYDTTMFLALKASKMMGISVAEALWNVPAAMVFGVIGAEYCFSSGLPTWKHRQQIGNMAKEVFSQIENDEEMKRRIEQARKNITPRPER